MKLTTLDKNSCRTLSIEAEQALKAVAEKYGLTVRPVGGSFSSANFTAKFEFSIVDTEGAKTRERQDFATYAFAYGLKPEDFGATFRSQGRVFKICGLKTRAPKAPILATEVATGRAFKFPAELVKMLLTQARV